MLQNHLVVEGWVQRQKAGKSYIYIYIYSLDGSSVPASDVILVIIRICKPDCVDFSSLQKLVPTTQCALRNAALLYK